MLYQLSLCYLVLSYVIFYFTLPYLISFCLIFSYLIYPNYKTQMTLNQP